MAVAPDDSRSIAGQIVDAIRPKITASALAIGDQLTSVRGLAQQLAVNPNTVSKACAELTLGGWLVSRARLGLYRDFDHDCRMSVHLRFLLGACRSGCVRAQQAATGALSGQKLTLTGDAAYRRFRESADTTLVRA
ncbi:GntR family transcriptional regulator [uncultured Sphingomonas sp.]|uniref:GntR family transcriptional regulator n=1 Tax=uncultured Sphingomonas sp. TaxID=158754 RepID=UPI0037494C91